jgi:predicted NBD/HSP70 family sugar kinase
MAAVENPATSPLLRRLNAEKVLGVLRRSGPMTAGDLMAATGLSRPTVHAVCEHLIDGGWVVERDARPPGNGSRVGRPARCYDFDARAGYALGIDLGAHKVRVVLADLRGRTLAEHTASFRHEAIGARARLAETREAIRRTLDSAGVPSRSVRAVAMGAAGPVDSRGHIVARDEYLPDLARHDLRAAVDDGFGGPVIVENDANLAVLAERWDGPAAGVDDVVVVLAGERFGSGVFLGGRLIRGAGGSAGELELLKLVDGVGSADGIGLLTARWGAEAIAAARAAGDTGVPAFGSPAFTAPSAGSAAPASAGSPAFTAPAAGSAAAGAPAASGRGGHPGVRAEAVFAAARAGDPTAAGIVERVVERLARVLAVLATLLNPELIVISGAVAGSGDVWLAPLDARLRELTPYPPRLATGAFGDHSVVRGAVRLALDHIEAHLLDDPPP